jgi:hypothetical protein
MSNLHPYRRAVRRHGRRRDQDKDREKAMGQLYIRGCTGRDGVAGWADAEHASFWTVYRRGDDGTSCALEDFPTPEAAQSWLEQHDGERSVRWYDDGRY